MGRAFGNHNNNAICGFKTLNFTPEMSGHGGFFESSDHVWRPHLQKGGLSDTDQNDISAVMAPHASSLNVKVTTLDATIGKMFEHIHFLMIDAEQAEPLILEGGMDLIRRSKDLTIVMEWMNGPTNSPSQEMRTRGVAIINALADDGFHFWNIDCDRSDIFSRPAILEPLTVEQVLTINQKADLFLRRRPPQAAETDWQKI
jgi:Methyltransferase FkbM domain